MHAGSCQCRTHESESDSLTLVSQGLFSTQTGLLVGTGVIVGVLLALTFTARQSTSELNKINVSLLHDLPEIKLAEF